MDLSKIGGDSQNTMPIAINAGLQARTIVKASVDPAAKFSVDAFKQSLNGNVLTNIADATKANLPIADALQQQGSMVRLASKIPFIKNWLGAEGNMNGVIGTLNDGNGGFLSKFIGGKGPAVGMNKVTLTRALYNAKTPQEIEQIVKSAKIADPAVAKQLIASAQERLAGGAATGLAETAAKQVVETGAKGAAQMTAGDIASEAASMTLKKGFTSAPAQEAIAKALASPEPVKALGKLGFYAKDAKGLVAKMTTSTVETTVKTGASEVVQKTTTSSTEIAAQGAEKAGGAKGFFGKLLGGVKGNFIVAGIFSLGSNAIQLAQHKISLTQFIGLTVMDTAAYGAIGWGSAAAGAAIGTALFPGVGTIAGFVIGLGLGFLGGSVYEKFVRTPVKGMLGGPVAGGAAPAADGGATTPGTPAGPARDPYTAGAGAPAAYSAGNPPSYEQALAQINTMN
jgi:hypothetical protein